jgi:hypothetical protein
MAKRTTSPKKTSRKNPLGVRWTDDERAALDACADDKGVGPTQVIRMAVKKYLDEHRRSKNAGQ